MDNLDRLTIPELMQRGKQVSDLNLAEQLAIKRSQQSGL